MEREQGVALTEFGLMLPLLLILTFAATEFGRAYYQYNTMVKAVREAARYLSVRSPNVNVAQAKNIVVYGNAAGTGSPLVPGLSLSNVPNPVWGTLGSYPTMNTVSISITGFTFVPMTFNPFGMALGKITFSTIQATMRSPS